MAAAPAQVLLVEKLSEAEVQSRDLGTTDLVPNISLNVPVQGRYRKGLLCYVALSQYERVDGWKVQGK